MTSDTAWSPQSYQPLRDARVLICTPEKWDSITRCLSSYLHPFLASIRPTC